jgi:two-component sensor histidine kinase
MAISVVVFEITERKQTERQRELLLRELDHRLKNVFGVISSMIGLQARRATSVAGFADGLRRRIYGLSALHDMVRGTGVDDAVSLKQVVQLAGAASSQMSFNGPDVRLSAAAAIGIGLVLNELVTNALKHGALSVPEGTVTVQWTTDDGVLNLVWAEQGGATVMRAADADAGFGTLLIQQSLAHLDGRTTLDWQPDGLRAVLTCPLHMLGSPANRTDKS